MPNWCENNITISGPAEKIETIYNTIKAKKQFLEVLVPAPENMYRDPVGSEDKKRLAEQGIPNWYDWQTANWGTKWEIDEEQIERVGFEKRKDGTASIGLYALTAWSPPITAMENFLSENEDCSARVAYLEEGNDFSGIWQDGAEIRSTGTYHEMMSVLSGLQLLEHTTDEFKMLNEEFDIIERNDWLLDDEETLNEFKEEYAA